jgi:hypothetical protein
MHGAIYNSPPCECCEASLSLCSCCSSPSPLGSHADAAALQACSDVCTLRQAEHYVAPLQTKPIKHKGSVAQVSALRSCAATIHCVVKGVPGNAMTKARDSCVFEVLWISKGTTSTTVLRVGPYAQTPAPPLPLQAPALSADTSNTQRNIHTELCGGGGGAGGENNHRRISQAGPASSTTELFNSMLISSHSSGLLQW